MNIVELLKQNATEGLDATTEVEELLEPVGGLPVIGPLTDELREQYVNLVRLELDIEFLSDTFQRRQLERQYERVLQLPPNTNAIEHLMDPANQAKYFDNPQEARTVHKMLAQHEYLKSQFWFQVRTKADNWLGLLSIRSGFRVVEVGKKYRG